MHEVSLATSVLDTVERLVAGGVIETVRVAVGELSAVEPELLAFAWEAVVSGTRHQHSRLVVDWIPARQTCPRCRVEIQRSPGQWHFNCARCGSPLTIEGGYEMDIMEVTFREAAPEAEN